MQIAFRNGRGEHSDQEVFWRADGTSFPVEYWSYPVFKAGKIVGAVVTFLDITARTQSEEEQRKLASLVENSDDFIGIASPQGKLLYLNGGGARLIGLDNAQEALGQPIGVIARHPWPQGVFLAASLALVLELGALLVGQARPGGLELLGQLLIRLHGL